MNSPILTVLVLVVVAVAAPSLILVGVPALLLIVALVVLSMGIATALSSPRRWWPLAFIGPVVAISSGVFLMYAGVQDRQESWDGEVNPKLISREIMHWPSISTVSMSEESEKAGKPSAEAAGITQKPPPDWATKAPYREGDTYRMVVKCGPVNDLFWRDYTIDMKMLAGAGVYIDDVLYRDRVSDQIDLDAKFVRENCLVEEWPKAADMLPGEEVYVSMKFDKRFRDEVDRRYRAAMSLGRVVQAGGVAGVTLAVLAGLYGFLRLTKPKITPAPLTPTP